MFVDESSISWRTIQTHAYSLVRKPLIVEDEKLRAKSLHIVAAVSLEYGFEGIEWTTNNINSRFFATILPKIEAKGRDFCVFLDNARWHKSKFIKDLFRNRWIERIFNVPYMPDLNPIEKYFS